MTYELTEEDVRGDDRGGDQRHLHGVVGQRHRKQCQRAKLNPVAEVGRRGTRQQPV